MDNILTVAEIAKFAGCAEPTVLYWIKKGLKTGKLDASVEYRGLRKVYRIEKAKFRAFWAKKIEDMEKETNKK